MPRKEVFPEPIPFPMNQVLAQALFNKERITKRFLSEVVEQYKPESPEKLYEAITANEDEWWLFLEGLEKKLGNLFSNTIHCLSDFNENGKDSIEEWLTNDLFRFCPEGVKCLKIMQGDEITKHFSSRTAYMRARIRVANYILRDDLRNREFKVKEISPVMFEDLVRIYIASRVIKTQIMLINSKKEKQAIERQNYLKTPTVTI